MNNRIISFKKLEPEIRALVQLKYPLGFSDEIGSYSSGSGKIFYAFHFTTNECNYLIKVDVNVDFLEDWDEDKEATNDNIAED